MWALAVGCAPSVQVRTVRTDSLFNKMRANILTGDKPSDRTLQTLRRYDLEEGFSQNPGVVLAELGRQVRAHPKAEDVFAMAELCHCTAKKNELLHKPEAMRLYLATASYCYYYLFDEALGDAPSQYDPRFRLACDLYNRSLAKCIGLAQKQEIRLDDSLRLDMVEGAVDLKIVRNGFLWQPEDFSEFKFAADYEVEGLSNSYRNYGLGVPLIAIRKAQHETPKSANAKVLDKYLPESASFPVTAFLRMHGGAFDDPTKCKSATLELFDPLRVQEVTIAGKTVPLESDLTTPLGYYLSRSNLDKVSLIGLIKADKVQNRTGLYFAQPYEPGKIPVVLVHGLWSSPMTWMRMYNDMSGDDVLRKNYQFWFFLYPTGNPFVHSAALLRKALNDVRRDFDPQGKDAALDQMVLVGHSMGGLLSKMQVQESHDDLWNLVSVKPFDKLSIASEEQDRVKQVFFFDSQPYIKRVIFIATPHRGSTVANQSIGRIANKLISLPKQLLDERAHLIAQNPDAFTPLFREGLPTSVQNLAPDSPIIQAVARLPMDRRVKFHSIIGNLKLGDPSGGSDGVVPYTSSHLEGAESELIVPANHNCHTHPRSVLEVQRILLEHLEAAAQAMPVKHALREIREEEATDAALVRPLTLTPKKPKPVARLAN